MHLAGQLLLNSIRFSSDYDGLIQLAKDVVPKIVGLATIHDVRELLEHSASGDEIQFITKDGLLSCTRFG